MGDDYPGWRQCSHGSYCLTPGYWISSFQYFGAGIALKNLLLLRDTNLRPAMSLRCRRVLRPTNGVAQNYPRRSRGLIGAPPQTGAKSPTKFVPREAGYRLGNKRNLGSRR
jgi:hypothetical protein